MDFCTAANRGLDASAVCSTVGVLMRDMVISLLGWVELLGLVVELYCVHSNNRITTESNSQFLWVEQYGPFSSDGSVCSSGGCQWFCGRGAQAGDLPDSSMQAIRVGQVRRVVCARLLTWQLRD
jgi:hypothetical protein